MIEGSLFSAPKEDERKKKKGVAICEAIALLAPAAISDVSHFLSHPREIVLLALLLQRCFEKSCTYSYQAEDLALVVLSLAEQMVRSFRFVVSCAAFVDGKVEADPIFAARLVKGMRYSVVSPSVRGAFPDMMVVEEQIKKCLDPHGAVECEGEIANAVTRIGWKCVCLTACGRLPPLSVVREVQQLSADEQQLGKALHWAESFVVGSVLAEEKDCFRLTLRLFASCLQSHPQQQHPPTGTPDSDCCKQSGGDLSEVAPKTWSVMRACASPSQPSYMHLLLTYPELPPFPRYDADCACHVACAFSRLDVVKYLRALVGLRFDRADGRGRTPLHIAAEEGCQPIVKHLVKNVGVASNSADDHGFTPLALACAKGHLSVVQYLVRRASVPVGVDASSSWNRHGFSLAHLAVESKSLLLVRYLSELVSGGKDLMLARSRTNYSVTPRYVAHRLGEHEICEYLEALEATATGTDGGNDDEEGDGALAAEDCHRREGGEQHGMELLDYDSASTSSEGEDDDGQRPAERVRGRAENTSSSNSLSWCTTS